MRPNARDATTHTHTHARTHARSHARTHTHTHARQGSARETFIAEGVILYRKIVSGILSQWRDWSRGVIRWVLRFFLLLILGWGKQNAWKAIDIGSRKNREKGIAGVAAWQNEWGGEYICSLSGKILPDGGNSAKLVVTEFGGFTNVVFHGQCAVEENAEAFGTVREWDCDVAKLKGVGGNRGQLLACSNKHITFVFSPFSWEDVYLW